MNCQTKSGNLSKCNVESFDDTKPSLFRHTEPWYYKRPLLCSSPCNSFRSKLPTSEISLLSCMSNDQDLESPTRSPLPVVDRTYIANTKGQESNQELRQKSGKELGPLLLEDPTNMETHKRKYRLESNLQSISPSSQKTSKKRKVCNQGVSR